MYMFRRFTGFVCILGCLFCTLATTQLTTFATELVPVTDTWIPLDDAWDTVAPLYDNYNTALSENSGVTITADNYKDYVIKSIIGNFVATHEAFGEDVSLDGIVNVIMADADLVNALGSATLVNPLNGAYYLGEAMGASLRSSIDNFLKTTFGLTDIMTTSEAVGLDFPAGRVFVKLVPSNDPVTVGNWLFVPFGDSTAPLNPNLYHASYGDGLYHLTTNIPNGVYITQVGTSGTKFYIATKEISPPASDTLFLRIGYYTYYSQTTWNTFIGSYSAVYPVGNYIYRSTVFSDSSALGVHMRDCLHYIGCYGYTDLEVAIADLYGGTPSGGDTYSDPVVVINDNEPPIISPTSVYNDWSTISNNNYNTYNTDYVTYNTGDSIYNYTYYYTINNYSNDMPLWVVNGKNLSVYEFDRETFYDFSNQNYTVSDDLVWDSSFFDFVWQNLPAELVGLLLTMMIAAAFFLLFRH